MPNGDLASARGWTTFASTQNRSQGYDNDNYGLDRTAEQAARLDVVEAAVNQPIFSVRAESGSLLTKYRQWSPAITWLKPRLIDGVKFANGQVTIVKPGVYRVQAHDQFSSDVGLTFHGMQINKNSADPAVNVICRDVPGSSISSMIHELVPFVAGDVLTLFIRQENTSSFDLPVAEITWSLEWVRA